MMLEQRVFECASDSGLVPYLCFNWQSFALSESIENVSGIPALNSFKQFFFNLFTFKYPNTPFLESGFNLIFGNFFKFKNFNNQN